MKDDDYIISEVAPISQDQTHGIKNYELIIKGYTLFVANQRRPFYPHIYLKQKLSKENLKFKADC